MEAGVGRGQRRGRHRTSCMLGNASLLLPHSSLFLFPHAGTDAHTLLIQHAQHTHRRPITRFCPQFHSFQLAFLHFPYLFFPLSASHTDSLSHSLTHYLHLFYFLSLSAPLIPPTPLHASLSFVNGERRLCGEDVVSLSGDR